MRYSQELKEGIVDFCFEHEEISLREVSEKYDIDPLTIRRWLVADPRFAARRTRYSDDLKSESIDYALVHPELPLTAIAAELGIPYATFGSWVLKDPRYQRRNRSFPSEIRQEILEYCQDHPSETLESVSIKYDVNRMTIHKWLTANPQYNIGREGNPIYSDAQKKTVLDWYYETPGAMHPNVYEEFGYPSAATFFVWVKNDPRHGMKDSRGYTEKHKREVCEYVLFNEGVTLTAAIEKYGYPSSVGTLRSWLAKFYGAKGRKQTRHGEEEYSNAVDCFFSSISMSIRGVASDFGFHPETLRKRVAADPRWSTDPRNSLSKSNAYYKNQQEVIDFYFSHPYLSIKQVSEHFRGHPHSATISLWVQKDSRYGQASIYGFTEEEKRRVLDYHFAHPDEHVDQIENELGFPIPRRGYKEWCKSDPRYKEGDRMPGRKKGSQKRFSFFKKAEGGIPCCSRGSNR